MSWVPPVERGSTTAGYLGAGGLDLLPPTGVAPSGSTTEWEVVLLGGGPAAGDSKIVA